MSASVSSFPFARLLMRALACFAAVSLCFDAGAAEPSSNDAAFGIARWAIVSSKAVKESGLADLVFVEAGKLEGIELVERDRADAIQEEAVLVLANETDVVEQRLELGRKLTADALVLLTMAEPEKQNQPGVAVGKCLKIVITDCRYGARLARRIVPANGPTDKLAQDVAACISETQKKYANGIERIVGVAPFVSRNIEHSFDYLQRGVAYLLESALSGLPGVAVLETEEAAEIATENLLVEETARQRIVPLFISGEFRVDARSPGNETIAGTVHLKRGSGQEETVQAKSMPLSSAAAWVNNILAARVIDLLGVSGAKPLSAEEQFDLLVREADSFAWLGEWKNAANLRDAALLLKPDDTKQAVKLVGESARAEQRIRGQDVLERLVRTKAINFITAVRLCHVLGGRDPNGQYLLDIGRFVQALPAGNGLTDVTGYARPQQSADEEWVDVIEEATVAPFREKWPEKKQDLDIAARLLTELLPHDCPWLDTLEGFLLSAWERRPNASEEREGKVSAESPNAGSTASIRSNEASHADWIAFQERLKASDNGMVRLAGRAGLVSCTMPKVGQFYYSDQARNEAIDRMRKTSSEIRSILAEAQVLQDKWRAGGPGRDMTGCGFFLAFDLKMIEDELRDLEAASQHQSAPQTVLTQDLSRAAITVPKASAPAANTSEEGIRCGKLLIRPLSLTVRTVDGKTVPFDLDYLKGRGRGDIHTMADVSLSIVACTTNLDVWWCPKVASLLRTDGALQEVAFLPREGGTFRDVAYDGRFIWIAYPETINVLDSSGRTQFVISRSDGLPPSQVTLIHRLRPGKTLIVGSLDDRGWIAVADCTGEKPIVSVIHEATRDRPTNTQSLDYEMDSCAMFNPAWTADFDEVPGGDTRLVLIGKTRRWGSSSRPLMVDTVSSNVWVLGYGLTQAGMYEECPVTFHGEIFQKFVGSVLHYGKTDDALQHGRSQPRCDLRLMTGATRFSGFPGLVQHNGWLYYLCSLGTIRLNPETGKEEILHFGGIPSRREYVNATFAESGIYGIIRFTETVGLLDQILVDNDVPPSTVAASNGNSPTQTSPSVVDREIEMRRRLDAVGFKNPCLRMDRNGRCVLTLGSANPEELRKLKGFPIRSLSFRECKDFINLDCIVGLSPDELDLRGLPVEDLSPLKGMNLSALNLARTKVKDISALQGLPLERLNLSGTPVTDISPLQGAPLKNLSLSKTAVSNIDCLAKARLEVLDISGTRVTDISVLDGMPLRELHLDRTGISDISALRQSCLAKVTFTNTPVCDLEPLTGKPIEEVALANTRVSSIESLRGMQVSGIDLAGTMVTDLRPLASSPLRWLAFPEGQITQGLVEMKAISSGMFRINSIEPNLFWVQYDASYTTNSDFRTIAPVPPLSQDNSNSTIAEDALRTFFPAGKIVVTSPKPNEVVVTPTYRITGYVETGGEWPSVGIRGNVVPVVRRKPPEQNTFDFSCEMKTDADGQEHVCITSSTPGDVVPLEAWANFTVRAARPEFVIKKPVEGDVVPNMHVHVTAQSQWSPKAQVTINGISASRHGVFWYAWVTMGSTGRNEIKAAFKDEFGRTATSTVSVMYEPPAGHDPNGDDDKDGAPNADDLFPLDPKEAADKDADGVGANGDPDDNDARRQKNGIELLSPEPGQVFE